MLAASIGLRLGTLDLDVSLEVGDGEVVALLGPNGAGKTTALRAVAGLEPLVSGRVSIDGAVLEDPVTGVFVPPHHRPVGVVFQDHLLFPRLSALDNVAFGLRARGASKADARRQALGWLDRVGLAAEASVRPAALSGGQAQRVALARALATSPRVLLLDEPLAALDVQRRAAVRADLRRHLAEFGGARLLVTHDPLDALVLAHRLVIVEGGRVTQSGTVDEVVARPASRYVAELVGLNLFEGVRVDEHTARVGEAFLVVADPLPSTDVSIVVRPQSVALHLAEPSGSPRNHWPAVVSSVEGSGDRVRVRLDGPLPLVAEVTAAAAADLGLRPGTAAWTSIKAVDLSAQPR